MLSTFSCAYPPSLYHLWKNVYSGPLSIFKSVFFFFFFLNKELYEFFIYCDHQPLIGDIVCKYLLRFSRLPFHFLVVSFTVKKVFSLTQSLLFVFVFIALFLGNFCNSKSSLNKHGLIADTYEIATTENINHTEKIYYKEKR